MAKNIRIIPESGSIILMQNGATEAQSVQLNVSGSDPSGSGKNVCPSSVSKRYTTKAAIKKPTRVAKTCFMIMCVLVRL